MQGRTYRYFKGTLQYPFGFGLSYTSFAYTWNKQLQTTYASNETIEFSVAVENTGSMDGDEVVQAYIEYPEINGMPLKELKAFKKVTIKKSGKLSVALSIPVSELKKWDTVSNAWKLYSGNYTLCLGKNANDYLLKKKFTIN